MQAAKSTGLENCLPSTRQPPPFPVRSLARVCSGLCTEFAAASYCREQP
jgi:hypothetical protein